MTTEEEYKRYYGRWSDCHAGEDGDCNWKECPQLLRDEEAYKAGRHCPLDVNEDES